MTPSKGISAPGEQAGPAPRKRVLVVEDNAAISGVIRVNLEQAGIEVVQAKNGREAWSLLERGGYDLVLTDQQMPEFTGCDLCRRMREHPRYRETPVIMLTAKGFELELRRLRDELGMSDLLTKPFSPRHLVETVKRHLAGECTPSASPASCPPQLATSSCTAG